MSYTSFALSVVIGGLQLQSFTLSQVSVKAGYITGVEHVFMNGVRIEERLMGFGMTVEQKGFLWDDYTDETKRDIETAIANARPIPGVKGWVTGSWQGSVRPTFGPYKGRSMLPDSKLARQLEFPPMTSYQLYYLLNPIIPHE